MILNELETVAPSLALNGLAQVYTVPAGYFDQFASTVLARLEQNPALPAVSHPFRVPVGYFEGLPASILQRIGHSGQKNEILAELEEIAPLLATLNRKPVLTVPRDYFEQLSPVIKKRPAKILAFRPLTWVQYAAAAVIAGILVTGGIVYTNSQRFNFSRELNNLSDDAMISYISNGTSPVANIDDTETLSDIDMTNVQDHLESISDDELKTYLKQAGDGASPSSGG